MGTQFWWFYDVLAAALTIGIVYVVVAKGFNKVVFQLAAFVASLLVGILGANFLAPKVYEEMFQDKVRGSIRYCLEDENFDIYESVSEALALSAAQDEKTPDAEELHTAFIKASKAPTPVLEDWYMEAFSNVLLSHLNRVQPMHPMTADTPIEWMSQPGGWCDVLTVFEEGHSADLVVERIEETCYRDNYIQLVRLAMFLLIELVMLIICCVIASMTNNLDQSMHLRRGDHVLAVPVALVEVIVFLFVICVTVRLIVQLTDGEMLLFNQPTIDETFVFRYLYGVQEMLF